MKRDRALAIAGIPKHKYYYKPKNGIRSTLSTTYAIQHIEDEEVLVTNTQVVDQIKAIRSEPDIEQRKYYPLR